MASALLEAGFRQAVMGSYPSETVTSLPEYSNQDPDFWDSRFLAAILQPVTFSDGAVVPLRPHPLAVTQRKMFSATLTTFTPICECVLGFEVSSASLQGHHRTRVRPLSPLAGLQQVWQVLRAAASQLALLKSTVFIVRLWPEFQTDLDACYENAFTNRQVTSNRIPPPYPPLQLVGLGLCWQLLHDQQ